MCGTGFAVVPRYAWYARNRDRVMGFAKSASLAGPSRAGEGARESVRALCAAKEDCLSVFTFVIVPVGRRRVFW